MPNQRKKGKKNINVFLSEKDMLTLKTLASVAGKNVSDMVRAIIRERAEAEGISVEGDETTPNT